MFIIFPYWSEFSIEIEPREYIRDFVIGIVSHSYGGLEFHELPSTRWRTMKPGGKIQSDLQRYENQGAAGIDSKLEGSRTKSPDV